MYKLIVICVTLVLAGCQTSPQQPIGSGITQRQLSRIDTKSYDHLSKDDAMRATISTLQDLRFVIDKVDYKAGSISGYNTNHGNGVHIIRLTVIVHQAGDNVVVQASALQVPNPGSYDQSQEPKPIHDLDAYQNFFAALSKTVSLLSS